MSFFKNIRGNKKGGQDRPSRPQTPITPNLSLTPAIHAESNSFTDDGNHSREPSPPGQANYLEIPEQSYRHTRHTSSLLFQNSASPTRPATPAQSIRSRTSSLAFNSTAPTPLTRAPPSSQDISPLITSAHLQTLDLPTPNVWPTQLSHSDTSYLTLPVTPIISHPETPAPSGSFLTPEPFTPASIGGTSSIFSRSTPHLDTSVHVAEQGNTYNIAKGAKVSFRYGAEFNINSGRGDRINTNNASLHRMVFDLSVNRFFKLAQRLIPGTARKAIYRWFESDKPLPQNTYARALMMLGYGYPIWRPVPGRNGPADVFRHGVKVGDVGILRVDGSFHFLFNVCETRGSSRAHGHGNLRKGSVTDYRVHEAGYVVRNAGYTLDGDTYYSYKAKGGILYLPEPLERHDSNLVDTFRRFALIHGREWYEIAYQEYEGNINGCLYLITGHDTTSSSLMAAHYSLHTVGIKLQAKMEKPKEAQVTLAWNENQGSGGVAKNFNPQVRDANGAILANQAVFIRGFRIKIRPQKDILFRDKKSQDAMEATLKRIGHDKISNSDIDQFVAKGTELPEPLRSRGGATRHPTIHSTRGESRFRQEDLYHPCDVINDFLLRRLNPEATIAVTHDDEWISLLLRRDEEMIGNGELIRRWLEKQYVPGRNVGIEYFSGTTVPDQPGEPQVFILQDIFFMNTSDIYPSEIRWSLVMDLSGQRVFISQGSYRVHAERLRLASFHQARLRWNIRLRLANGETVVSQGYRTIGSLLMGS